jgi:hypothetical protein
VVLPTGTLVLDSAGLRAIETCGVLEEGLVLVLTPLHPIDAETAAIMRKVRSPLEATTAYLLAKCSLILAKMTVEGDRPVLES